METKTAEKLVQDLAQANVPLTKWGHGKNKSLRDLIKEVDAGEAVVYYNRNMNLMLRYIKTILLEIYYAPGNGKTFHLVEESQTFNDGRPSRKRNQQCSVSETLLKSEKAGNEAVARALKEELGITNWPQSCHPTKEGRAPIRESRSYPGVWTCSEDFYYEIHLWDFQYKKEGYSETRGGITTRFVWEELKKADED